MSDPANEAHAHAGQLATTSRCRVVAVRRYGAFTVLEVVAREIAELATPGQFVMVAVPEGGAFRLRRPISIYAARGDRVGLLVEARGAGSERLVAVEVGEALELAGPLGTGFPVAGTHSALLVAGGIGCAPMQFLADALVREGAAVTAVFGFRDARQARAAAAFDLGRLWVSTEDGSVGRRGLVTDLLRDLDAPPSTTVYCCGPLAMVGGVQRWAAACGLAGYASLEAHMACGTGSCHGCVVSTTRGYLRVCSEGPVFALDEVVSP
jgi:dihydroorotate dehydrogenase electron transfer subunit